MDSAQAGGGPRGRGDVAALDVRVYDEGRQEVKTGGGRGVGGEGVGRMIMRCLAKVLPRRLSRRLVHMLGMLLILNLALYLLWGVTGQAMDCPLLAHELEAHSKRNPIVQCADDALPQMRAEHFAESSTAVMDSVFCSRRELPVPEHQCSSMTLARDLRPEDVPGCPDLVGSRVRDISLMRRFSRTVPLYIKAAQLVPPPGKSFLSEPTSVYNRLTGLTTEKRWQASPYCHSKKCRAQLQREMCEYGAHMIGLCGEEMPEHPTVEFVQHYEQQYAASGHFAKYLDEHKAHNGGVCFAFMVRSLDSVRVDVMQSTLRILQHPKHSFVMHIDPSVSKQQLRVLVELQNTFTSLHFMRNRLAATARGSSEVAVQYALALECLSLGEWDHVVLLTESTVVVQNASVVNARLHSRKGLSMVGPFLDSPVQLPLRESHFVLDQCANNPVQVHNILRGFKHWAWGSRFEDAPELYAGVRDPFVVLSRPFVHELATSHAATDLLRTGLHHLYLSDYFFATLLQLNKEFRDKRVDNIFHRFNNHGLVHISDICAARNGTSTLFLRDVADRKLASIVEEIVEKPHTYQNFYCSVHTSHDAVEIAKKFERRVRTQMDAIVEKAQGILLIRELVDDLKPYLTESLVAQCITYHLLEPLTLFEARTIKKDRENQLRLAALTVSSCRSWEGRDVNG